VIQMSTFNSLRVKRPPMCLITQKAKKATFKDKSDSRVYRRNQERKGLKIAKRGLLKMMT